MASQSGAQSGASSRDRSGPAPEIPEGMSSDARETWPSRELIDSFLGTGFDFELRLGERTPIPTDDPAVAARARQFRDVLGLFCTGVTVVTSMSGEEPVGMTCQSFSSVSLEPALVLFCPAKTSRAWPLIQRSGRFAVNLLAHDQAELSNQMASKGVDKFDGVRWSPSQVTGSPLLEGILGYVDCTIQAVHEAGDHYVVIGKLLDLGEAEIDDPLLFFQGRYRTTDR